MVENVFVVFWLCDRKSVPTMRMNSHIYIEYIRMFCAFQLLEVFCFSSAGFSACVCVDITIIPHSGVIMFKRGYRNRYMKACNFPRNEKCGFDVPVIQFSHYD